jgi:hypothetical protein
MQSALRWSLPRVTTTLVAQNAGKAQTLKEQLPGPRRVMSRRSRVFMASHARSLKRAAPPAVL